MLTTTTTNHARYVHVVAELSRTGNRRQPKPSGLRRFTADDVYNIYNAFVQIDQDKNGLLSHHELLGAVGKLDSKVTARDIGMITVIPL
jgi:Ca2+-binding EF-hand superfamily protein